MPRRRAVMAGALAAPALMSRLVRAESDTPVLRIAVQALPPTLEPLEAISNPVCEYFAKRRSIRWTHYPLYYMDFRSDNLSFA